MPSTRTVAAPASQSYGQNDLDARILQPSGFATTQHMNEERTPKAITDPACARFEWMRLQVSLDDFPRKNQVVHPCA